jgi:O-glycosyl hydrolase
MTQRRELTLFLLAPLLTIVILAAELPPGPALAASNITIDASPSGRMQTIDGFGTCYSSGMKNLPFVQKPYYDDLGCSILRVDLTPHFKPPVSSLSYFSPWFMGGGTHSAFNIEDPANRAGPEGNGCRTYTGPAEYSRPFGGEQAPIAVMGPDINANVKLFDFDATNGPGLLARAGLKRKAQLGDFKLYGSLWSPAPWVKMSSGHAIQNTHWPQPVSGTPWPFIWAGNFAGGRLDVSDTPLDVFNDGTGPTSALTQFSRSIAAYLRGFQNDFGVKFYAISIQNELAFEEFYSSCQYPTAASYIAALKAVRRELDKYPDLKPILIAGPEDVIGGDGYGMWQYGGGDSAQAKNLQFLDAVSKDPEALNALGFCNIHGYASDGVTSAGADSGVWNWWLNGWEQSPAPGIPDHIKGFAGLGKKSWMTETSGESSQWLDPAAGFPSNGAWSIAFKTQQALTAGQQSAILYWQFAEKPTEVTREDLTCLQDGTRGPKYIAAKHFFKYIRPGAVALKTTIDDPRVTASAYLHEKNHTLTIVLVNRDADAHDAVIQLPKEFTPVGPFATFTSSQDRYWIPSATIVQNGALTAPVPGYGVVTLVGK